MTTIDRLLIANRGEIACRIARTAHRLGIQTVGVYAEPDANSLHVDSVHEAFALGGTTPSDSYLKGELILEIAQRSGARAIHPGYGFLAENARFAQSVMDAGLVWVGPTPDQIRLLGDKVAAKRAARDAGVPTTEFLEVTPSSLPKKVPLPALVKAAAGGGGRGMRIVRTADELDEAVSSASREALAAFGDGTVFIEPLIERGRHVEVQILGDQHGNILHFGERECSIQRRNQKIIEEAPSAGISDELRTSICDGAIALARAVGYENAGTVEFLVGEDESVTFLEVNTRLQVEHPITEMISGVDLVEFQLLAAAGEELSMEQGDISPNGHAIEVRLVAEQPASGWLPSTGTIREFEISPDVRTDTGIRPGAAVSADYDSLLAKVISHGPDRTTAIRKLADALRRARVTGVETNLAALVAILEDEDFLAAKTPTVYLDEHPHLAQASGPSGRHRTALLVGAVLALEGQRHAASPTRFAPSGWRSLRTRGQQLTLTLDNNEHPVEYERSGDQARLLIGAAPAILEDGSLADDQREALDVRILRRTDSQQTVEVDGHRTAVDTEIHGNNITTSSPHGTLVWGVEPRFRASDLAQMDGGPICPLPGTVVSVRVAVGDRVTEGELLVVVEAMKMEHRITSTLEATVSEIHFGEGDRVDSGDLLITLEAVD